MGPHIIGWARAGVCAGAKTSQDQRSSVCGVPWAVSIRVLYALETREAKAQARSGMRIPEVDLFSSSIAARPGSMRRTDGLTWRSCFKVYAYTTTGIYTSNSTTAATCLRLLHAGWGVFGALLVMK